jgi:hypothetical protein
MGLVVGFVVSYPINWWLVMNHLKHGMMTVRPALADAQARERVAETVMPGMAHKGPHMSHESCMSRMSMPTDSGQAPRPPVPVMAVLSFLAMAAGVTIGLLT